MFDSPNRDDLKLICFMKIITLGLVRYLMSKYFPKFPLFIAVFLPMSEVISGVASSGLQVLRPLPCCLVDPEVKQLILSQMCLVGDGGLGNRVNYLSGMADPPRAEFVVLGDGWRRCQ